MLQMYVYLQYSSLKLMKRSPMVLSIITITTNCGHDLSTIYYVPGTALCGVLSLIFYSCYEVGIINTIL